MQGGMSIAAKHELAEMSGIMNGIRVSLTDVMCVQRTHIQIQCILLIIVVRMRTIRVEHTARITGTGIIITVEPHMFGTNIIITVITVMIAAIAIDPIIIGT